MTAMTSLTHFEARLALVHATAIWVLVALGPTCGYGRSSQQSTQNTFESQLQLGEAVRAERRDASIPVDFAPVENLEVGRIWAEVTVPEGPWKFDKIEITKGLPLNVQTRKRNGDNKRTVIEVDISAGNREVPSGRIAAIKFSLENANSPVPSGLTIRTLQVLPPQESAPLTPPDEPPPQPLTGCFFFTH